MKKDKVERGLQLRRRRPGRALLIASLLVIAAPRAAPTDVIRVEDPEPLPEAAQGRVAPAAPITRQDPALPAAQQPPISPDRRIGPLPVQPARPERALEPSKPPADAPK